MEEQKTKKLKTFLQVQCGDYGSYAAMLREDHVCVVPVFSHLEVKAMNQDFFKMAREWPEYQHFADPIGDDAVRRVYGSFGAYGNPSSFHDPVVREWRMQIYERMSIPLFKSYDQDGRNLEVLIDRLQQRRIYDDGIIKNTKLNAEDWHRDESKNTSKNDEIFGGWVNLDIDDDQFFVCVKGTAIDSTPDGTGFARLSKEDIEAQNLNLRSFTVSIPPGCMIVFKQSIIHAILPQTLTPKPSIRMYMGHRLTYRITPLYPENLTRIKELAVPRIPSGQWPTMFSANHFQIAGQIFRFAEFTFVPAVLTKRECKHTNKTYMVPGISKGYIAKEKHKPDLLDLQDKTSYYRTMRSLRSFVNDADVLKKFEYAQHDLEMFKPQSLKDI